MRRLKAIFSLYHNADAKREILFADGKWCIYRYRSDSCYLIHRCAKARRAQIPKEASCHACGDVMPIALKGLFILNEWKR